MLAVYHATVFVVADIEILISARRKKKKTEIAPLILRELFLICMRVEKFQFKPRDHGEGATNVTWVLEL